MEVFENAGDHTGAGSVFKNGLLIGKTMRRDCWIVKDLCARGPAV